MSLMLFLHGALCLVGVALLVQRAWCSQKVLDRKDVQCKWNYITCSAQYCYSRNVLPRFEMLTFSPDKHLCIFCTRRILSVLAFFLGFFGERIKDIL